jgi:hypothetical protein
VGPPTVTQEIQHNSRQQAGVTPEEGHFPTHNILSPGPKQNPHSSLQAQPQVVASQKKTPRGPAIPFQQQQDLQCAIIWHIGAALQQQ